MNAYHHIIVGAGINALVCAAMLSRKRRVLVLEREAVAGGTMRTATLAEGFTYDPLATTFVLFMASPAYAALGEALAAEGLTFAKTAHPTGVLMVDGRALALSSDRAANIAAFDALAAGDGVRHGAEMAGIERDADLIFGLFNNRLWSAATLKRLAREAMKRGPRGFAAFFGEALVTNRRRLEHDYGSDLVAALSAPWPLHAGLTPEQPFSGKMAEVMMFALEAIGAPVAVGGAARVAEALVRVIEARGGTVRTGAEVAAVTEAGGRASGVRLATGETIAAPSVICSVTPGQLYGRLLAGWSLPEGVTRDVRRYHRGRADMQLHYALKRPIAWPDASLADVQLVHLCDGVDAVSKASNEAERGMLPERPTVCVGQPTAADPSRAPAGQAVVWIQLPDCPRVLKGDAAGTIETPADGRWTEAVREAYADRVEAMIAAHDPGFRDQVVARRALSPVDIEAMNVNLEGGDPYGGWCGLDQFFLFRPFANQVNHRTPAKGVSMIGASTHPGPGLGGMSGYLAAEALT
ncbi:phytoene desaturase family protein [Acuticoccus mangrovi]|uniref:Pyridine nucleotide-disulfide oxidoreductase domain-containing protein 2 n=1 Tax=Acuticoccus mangrovi TaxID=2796142 RepID=A0A934MEU2_9HYPH|nr:NAD(P)/FAD-dependent oxidoreductase [Acuticoccus mangrovi]MBJ3777927.1 NAD(P)/FAD-dependent oxidoreductase [Acuticoccus mangrovi]